MLNSPSIEAGEVFHPSTLAVFGDCSRVEVSSSDDVGGTIRDSTGLTCVILESKPGLCGVSSYQLSCVRAIPSSKQVDTSICGPGGVVVSPSEKVDGISSCYIVASG